MINSTAKIHPSAHIDPTAWIGPNVEIGPEVWIGPYCVIGARPQHIEWIEKHGDDHQRPGVVIEYKARLEKLVVVDSGAIFKTRIGADCLLMSNTHVGHDAWIGSKVVISEGAKVAGHAKIWTYTNIGMNAVIHQGVEIADKCMIGMGAVVTKKAASLMKSCETWAGNPARLIGPNKKWA